MQKFYRQAEAQVEERRDILPFAPALKAMMETKAWSQRQGATLAQLRGMSFSAVLALLGKFMKFQQFAMAEVVYSLGHTFFQHDDSYLALGISVFRKSGRARRALALAREYIERNAGPASYMCYFECLLDAGERKEARAIRAFLQTVAQREENASIREMLSDFLHAHADGAFSPDGEKSRDGLVYGLRF
ncbi:MAG: hypothetical protein LBN33_04635 [Desulfovibrio sp.]|nr:hypothetical protein [Desulfovibrio sp.]